MTLHTEHTTDRLAELLLYVSPQDIVNYIDDCRSRTLDPHGGLYPSVADEDFLLLLAESERRTLGFADGRPDSALREIRSFLAWMEEEE